MESNDRPKYVIIDANAYRDTNILCGTLAASFLGILANSKAKIILPEITEREVLNLMKEKAVQAALDINNDLSVLRALVRSRTQVQLPSRDEIDEGVQRALADLKDVAIREPFDLNMANAALDRIFEKKRPCGKDNEQFRDACFWHVCLKYAATEKIAVITKDRHFLNNPNTAGLHPTLLTELPANAKLEHFLSIDDFVKHYGQSQARNETDLVRNLKISLLPVMNDAIKRYLLEVDQIMRVEVERHPISGRNNLALFEVATTIKSDAPDVLMYDEVIFKGSCAVQMPNFDVSDVQIDSTRMVASGRVNTIAHLRAAAFTIGPPPEPTDLERARAQLLPKFLDRS